MSASKDQTSALRSALTSYGCTIVDNIHSSDPATRLWNGALHPSPALIARCQTTEQVSRALHLARDANQPVCVHAGGQDWNGRSLRDGSLVLDLSGMNSVTIDVERHEATIGGGVTVSQLHTAATERGLAAVVGNDGAVGMPGLFMAGGYGPLMSRYGLACDSVLAAEVVLPDGKVVKCNTDSEPDLFWAIRGGGGNFGIVTSARIRLHEVKTVLSGTIIFPLAAAKPALSKYAELMKSASPELFAAAVLATGPAGKPVAVFSVLYTGSEERGEEIVSKIAKASTPIMSKSEQIPASAILGLTDGKLPQGRGYDVGTRWFEALSTDAIDTLLAGFDARSSPMSSIIIHHCHGTATSEPSDATAFGQRTPHFTALIYAAWEPASADATVHHTWLAKLVADLEPFASQGGYANLLSDRSTEQVASAYGSNASRLSALKQRYDPTGLLRAIPLPA